MRNAKRGLLTVLGVVIALSTACASKPQAAATGMSSVQGNQQALQSNAQSLEEAQSELRAFQKTLKGLSEEMARNEGMRSRTRATESLNRLSLNIQQAQLDLGQLREENRLAAEDLNRRLKNAASENQQVIERGDVVPAE